MELKEFFTLCEKRMPSKSTQLRRTSFSLRRNGITTMEELCKQISNSPEEIEELRDVGQKSLVLVRGACLLYEKSEA